MSEASDEVTANASAAVREFGYRVKSVRNAAGISSARRLAAASDRSENTVADACGGTKFPTRPTVEAIAQACWSAPEAGRLLTWWDEAHQVVDPASPRYGQRWPLAAPELASSLATSGDVPATELKASAVTGSVPDSPHAKGRRRRALAAAVTLLIVAAGILVVVLQRRDRPVDNRAAVTWTETTGTPAHTWADKNVLRGAGPPLGPRQSIQVSCRVRGYVVQDGDPWWYRIESPPWRGRYYATSDAFYNNGSTSGPVVNGIVVDEQLPLCSS